LVLAVPDRQAWVVGSVLACQAGKRPDAPFLQWEYEAPLTYAEVNRRVNRLAHGLSRVGVTKGDFVSLMLPNSTAYILLWFALSKLGAVPAPVNTAFRGAFLENAVMACRAKIAIIGSEYLDAFHDSLDRLPLIEQVFVDGLPKRTTSKTNLHVLADLESSDGTEPPSLVTPRDPALALYTSGTTGPSKAVLLSHAQVHFFGETGRSLARLTDSDVSLNAFPMYHGNTLFQTVYPSMLAGGKAVLYEKFSASQWARRMRAHQVTHTTHLGVTMDWVFKQPPRADDETMLRVMQANPTAHKIRAEFERRFNVGRTVEAYGQTETCAPVLCPYDAVRPPGAMGTLLADWFDARIVDPETDEDVPEGQSGEMIVRAKVPWITTLGYFGNPEGTARASRNLWWHTGDRLRRDAEGWYYFEDRTNDAMRVKAENVSSYEVEQLILSHPAVRLCAVIGVASQIEAGEHDIKAVLVLHDGQNITPEEFVQFCERRLPWFAVPRYVDIRDTLPLNDLGKIRKDVLRAEGNIPSTWDREAAGFLLTRDRERAANGTGAVRTGGVISRS
jgi:crotonobetaine/carnitine-CoA ligase